MASTLCCCLLALGCIPSLGEDERVQVLTYGPNGYTPDTVPLPLTSLRPLETGDIRVFFGGTLGFMGGPEVREPATPLHARVERGTNGSLVPTDYLTLLALCVLHHLEASRQYIAELDVPGIQDEPPYDVFLHPQVSSGQLGDFTDNMAYVRGANWFLVAPESDIDALPLACNRAVVAHEFAHALSFHSDPTQRFPSGDVVAIDEGFADIIGAGVTSSATGVRASFQVGTRDLNVARVDEPMLSPHERGAVLASVFWAYRGALVAASTPIDEANDAMVRLALETLLTFRDETAPLLHDFVLRAIGLAPYPERFCQRAPLAFPTMEVALVCAD
ncbi:MAG: hypothetical protein ACI9KE_000513 [Polyangiales bacterium]|jgi:hypothetical protein